jgi:hypothetical protein
MPDNTANAPDDALSYRIPAGEKEHFLRFVKEGEKENGAFKKDANGTEMTGVVAWLKSNGHTEARFFSLDQPNGDVLFIVTANATPPVDWNQIPGFEKNFGRNTRLKFEGDINAMIAPAPPQPGPQ